MSLGKVMTYLLSSLKVPSKAQTRTDFLDGAIGKKIWELLSFYFASVAGQSS